MAAMRISLILTGYIARHFLVAFLGTLLAIMGLILLFETIELMRRAANREDAEFSVLLVMAAMKLPQMLHTVLPFAVMIGAMITFWRLTRTHELVVARAAGVSVWQFLTPVMLLVLLVGALNVTVFNPLAASLFSRYEQMEDRLMLRYSNPLSLSHAGLWLRESHAGANASTVIYARNVRQEGVTLAMRHVSVFQFEGQDRFVRRVEADTGRLGDGYIELSGVAVMQPGLPTAQHESMRVPTTLTLAKIQDNFASPETLSFWALPDFIEFFEAAGFSAHAHRLHFQALLSSPFLLCAMVLLAATVSLRPSTRGGGLLVRILAGVAAGFLLFFFSKVVYALGQSTTLPLTLAAWSPALVASLIGLALLFHLEDG